MSLLGLALAASATPPQARLTPQMLIQSSRIIAKGVYRIPTGENLKTPAIRIQGNNITIDFKGAILEGSAPTIDPDQRKGLALLVQGRNITIRHLTVRGYKVGLLARDCPGLKILDSDFSYNWKQHLASTLEKEDESDWQSYHHNDHDEWLYGRPAEGVTGYAGAIYLHGCTNYEVRGCKATHGQCGLMLTQCDKGLVWNNDFSFMSGIGLAMYRSSQNRIMHNKIDWCVRGFSYGVYNRGQDSAGILIYEQSNNNVFAYNSVTHGGDGFFLWAGQTTMDTGKGGCNDNLLYGNDFSHAPTNGIEATFSRNDFVNNLVLECWHGIWGGYGFDSRVIGNTFGHNAEAIAWEHGQNVDVAYNTFEADNEGINIWADPHVDPSWGYGKSRDIRSRDWRIEHNNFNETFANVFRINNTINAKIDGNAFDKIGKLFTVSGENPGLEFFGNDVTGTKGNVDIPDSVKPDHNRIMEVTPGLLVLHPSSSLNQGDVSDTQAYLGRFRTAWNPFPHTRAGMEELLWEAGLGAEMAKLHVPAPLKGGQNPFLKSGALRGWRYMFVDEWGPYDFKRPILWPRGKAGDGAQTSYEFEIVGPPGTWKVVQKDGVASLSPDHGKVEPGSMIHVTLPAGKAANIKLTLEYRGQATTDYRGIVTPAGKPVRFGYSKFFAPIDWTIGFHKWTKSSNPAEPHANPDEKAFEDALRVTPLKVLHTDKLDFAGASFDPVTGNDHFATVADGKFTIPPGDYVLEMTCDDGARLWLDGKPLIEDAWHYQGPTLYSRNVHLGAGEHYLRVEHFQIDGYAMLKVNLRPKK